MTGERPAAFTPPAPPPPGATPPLTSTPDTSRPHTSSDTSGADTGGPCRVDAVPAGARVPVPRPCRSAGRRRRDPNGLPEPARDLVRAQLRIALGTGAVVPAVVTGLPVLLAAAPAIAGTRLLGVPLWWAVLAFGVQPLWIAVSRWQLGRAERAERDRAGAAGLP